MIDISFTLNKLIPMAEYGGSLTPNTEESYNLLRWEDSRSKPNWKEIENTWKILEIEILKQNCKTQAKQLLSDSDWSEIPSVIEQLENANEWKLYRMEIRKFIINPIENPIFPNKPETLWRVV